MPSPKHILTQNGHLRQGRIQKLVLGGTHWTWVAEDDETRRRKRWKGDVMGRRLSLLIRLGAFGERCKLPSEIWGGAPTANVFGHYTRNFVRFHACFNASWNLTGKANKTDRSDHFCLPWVWRGPPVPPSGSARDLRSFKVICFGVNEELLRGYIVQYNCSLASEGS